MKNKTKDVYILGDSDTSIFPVTMDTATGDLDYVGIAFSNKKYLTGVVPKVGGADLVIGFKTLQSIDSVIARLMDIREVLSETATEE